MSKIINKKAISTIAALATAFTLTACSNSNDESDENTTEEVSTAEENDNKDDKNAKEDTNDNDSLEDELKPSASTSDNKDIQKASSNASSYFNYVFNNGITDNPEEIEGILQGMVDIGGEETFNSDDPIVAMDALSDEKRKELLEYTEEYVGESNKYVNYDKISDSEKIVMNIITIMFRSTIPTYLSGTESKEPIGVKVEVDEKLISEPKDDKITIPSSAFIGTSADYTDNSLVTDDVIMVKDGNDWKIDAKEFIKSMMAPQELPEEEVIQ